MKKLLVSICTILAIISNSSAQTLDGCYKNGKDSLSFSNGNVAFCLSGFGALSTLKVGHGAFEQVGNNYVLIQTTEYPGSKTTMERIDATRKDTITITIYSSDGYVLSGALVEVLAKSGKTIAQGLSTDYGKVVVPMSKKSERLRVSNSGSNSIEFPFDVNNDYVVRMGENEIIENQTVALKVTPIDEEIISVLLLTTDFDPKKDRDKELEKAEKRVQKQNVLAKRLRKEYIPTFYNR